MEDKIFKLKSPLELGKMERDEFIQYIDKIHNIIKNYQVVFDIVIHKNENVQ